LRSLAKKHKLLVCAGTDFHSMNGPGSNAYAIHMPWLDWNNFRTAVFSSSTFAAKSSSIGEAVPATQTLQASLVHSAPRFRRRYIALRIFLPTFIAIALFLAAFWGIILPSLAQSLLQQKRETIHELTNSAWSILASYEADERNGLLTRQQAQALAIADIEALRYGPEGKDYFWIQDMQPRMIMHPYRKDFKRTGAKRF
jgi:hypothetical protein